MSEVLLVKRPAVAKTPRAPSMVWAAVLLGILGLGIFLWLSEARAASAQDGTALPPLFSTTAPAPAPLAVAQATTATPPAQPFFIPNSGPVTLVPTQPTGGSGFVAPAPISMPAPAPTVRANEGLRSPALVVDLAQAEVPRAPGQPATGRVGGPAQAPAPVVDRNLSETERFAARVGGEELEIAQARRMTGLDRLVPQGAIIGAVMESALNSDLPGYVRAVTQRDVYSFDGSAVLIPAGSRIIGQYKSGVAQGASRVFILWTRLIRTDGVSVDLASPAVDELGRGGVGGKVNRHFLQRFGGAILTSVLTGGVNAAAAALSGGSTIIVGSAGQAASLAGEATRSDDIPPTITTRQGAGVRIFVARDLDFTRVGPAR
ncbi:MAG: TrbI/VirB10 family protein [Sphingomonas sp.]|nr:TrbI/VirB10 family protein [Sphingomonas sp.]